MPEMPDVVAGETIESEWGNDIRDRTVQRYTNLAERSSLVTSPLDGDLSFLEDSGTLSVYYAGAWRTFSYNDTQTDTTTALDTSVATGFSTMATLTFTPPAGWASYRLVAWATVAFYKIPDTFEETGVQARLNLGGDIGPTANSGATVVGLGVSHKVEPISGAALSVVVQGRKLAASPVVEADTSLTYIATRLT
jgi:hypothetical protein